jgi:hypothetical protein
MASPFSNPKEQTPRPRIFLWGMPGAGKTTAALSFGKVALIDLEKGSQYYAGKFNFDRLDANTSDEVMEAVKWLATQQHDYNTLVIDPITVYWDLVQDKWLTILRRKKGPDYQLQFQDWKPIKSEYNALLELLNKLDMNVIVTARSSARYVDGEIASVDKADPEKPDAEKSTAYLMDIELQLRMVKSAKDKPAQRIAYVRKDRTGKLPTEPFVFSYEAMRECFGGIVDKASQPMTQAQVAQATATEAPQAVLCECGAQVDPKTIPACMKHFGKPVCVECGNKALEAKKNGNGNTQTEQPKNGNKGKPATDKTMARLCILCDEVFGKDEGGIAVMRQWFGSEFGVESRTELSDGQKTDAIMRLDEMAKAKA